MRASVRLHERMQARRSDRRAKEAHPNALVVDTSGVYESNYWSSPADYIGSTSGIIDYATNSDAERVYRLYGKRRAAQTGKRESGKEVFISRRNRYVWI